MGVYAICSYLQTVRVNETFPVKWNTNFATGTFYNVLLEKFYEKRQHLIAMSDKSLPYMELKIFYIAESRLRVLQSPV